MGTAQEALSAALERCNEGDLDGCLALYAADIRLHGYSPEPMTEPEVRSFYEGICIVFENPRLEFHELCGTVTRVRCASRWRAGTSASSWVSRQTAS